jgi:uncharacterized membrane protein YeaQ/YmgE (transglycosylase-associated protein family)
MGILAWLLVGLIAGWLAQVVTRAEARGCLGTIVVGILGALIGGALFNWATDGDAATFDDFDLGSILVAFLGACLLLLVLQAIGPRTRRR